MNEQIETCSNCGIELSPDHPLTECQECLDDDFDTLTE